MQEFSMQSETSSCASGLIREPLTLDSVDQMWVLNHGKLEKEDDPEKNDLELLELGQAKGAQDTTPSS